MQAFYDKEIADANAKMPPGGFKKAKKSTFAFNTPMPCKWSVDAIRAGAWSNNTNKTAVPVPMEQKKAKVVVQSNEATHLASVEKRRNEEGEGSGAAKKQRKRDKEAQRAVPNASADAIERKTFLDSFSGTESEEDA